jgi:Na+/proline symporter
MVIVATIACSTMLCNEIVMPALVKLRGEEVSRRPDLARLLILHPARADRRHPRAVLAGLPRHRHVRRAGSIGLLSFALAAQFGPAMIGGLYWRRATRAGAIAGMSAGFAIWIWTLLIPAFAQTGWLPASLVGEGPFGIAWLSPYALFGVTGLDPVTHGVFWSLGANIFCFVGVSLLTVPRLMERRQAAAFVGESGDGHSGLLPSPAPIASRARPRSATCAFLPSASSAGTRPRRPLRRICAGAACRSPRECEPTRRCWT